MCEHMEEELSSQLLSRLKSDIFNKIQNWIFIALTHLNQYLCMYI